MNGFLVACLVLGIVFAGESALSDSSGREAASEPFEDTAYAERIASCWLYDSSAPDAGALAFTLEFDLNPDGTVAREIVVAEPWDWKRPGREQAVSSAMRAIRRCGNANLILPVEKYGQWKKIRITFDPTNKALSF